MRGAEVPPTFGASPRRIAHIMRAEHRGPRAPALGGYLMSNHAPRLRTLLALSASALSLTAVSAPAHAQDSGDTFQI